MLGRKVMQDKEGALGWLGCDGRKGCLIFRWIGQGDLPEELTFGRIPTRMKQEARDNFEGRAAPEQRTQVQISSGDWVLLKM